MFSRYIYNKKGKRSFATLQMLAKSEYSSSACPHDFLSSAGLHWQTRPQFRARQTIAVRTAFRLPFCQKVDVRITRSTIEVFFDGNRICSHRRLYGRANQYSTIEEHMPPSHQQYVQWNGERFRTQSWSIARNLCASGKECRRSDAYGTFGASGSARTRSLTHWGFREEW